MYPQLPKSPADLVPLPLCEGPKLKPFDFKGPQDIEFIEELGSGQHSFVFKVRIRNKLYALKLFVFTEGWHLSMPGVPSDSKEAMSAVYQYMDTFNRECRAFGRLQESGWQDLGIECFGYVLLDNKHERMLRDKFPDMNCVSDWFPSGAYDEPVLEDCRFRRRRDAWFDAWLKACKIDQQALDRRFPVLLDGDAGACGPPIRGILKALGTLTKPACKRDDTRYFTDLCKMQQLGITGLDPNDGQLVDWKQADFSIAITTPHPLLTPFEMNPRIGPEWLPLLEFNAFSRTSFDYNCFNNALHHRPALEDRDWNPKTDAPPDYDCRGRPGRYDLRKMPHRHPFAFVDPRKYDWRPAVRGRATTRASSNGSKAGRPRGISKACNPGRLQLKDKPDRWYLEYRHPTYDCELAKIKPKITWEYRGGHFFPRGSAQEVEDELMWDSESIKHRREKDWGRVVAEAKTRKKFELIAEPQPRRRLMSEADYIMRLYYPKWCSMSAEEQAQIHEKTCRELVREFWAPERGLAQEPEEVQAQIDRLRQLHSSQLNATYRAWSMKQRVDKETEAERIEKGQSLEERAPGEGFCGWLLQYSKEIWHAELLGWEKPAVASFVDWTKKYLPELWALEVQARDAEARDAEV
ncbi:uncharacterized protein E0L32_000099 [Thyridium curvatum]|uniref:Uncharacterized protein n=1 Tax=Thyridium curvatum TaxID=1093900 RepID=A0A507AY95_9PEZI|nr:uncharacterized protein E0L32_000099 [Thyridium curvatum]TPX15765.1 hypothetical protein E0L32_000099 [Thyridium curvatum]